jgi:hypothetical protein
MRVAPHGEHLIELTRFPRFFPVGAYLVREDDGFTLVDTASRPRPRESWQRPTRTAARSGASCSPTPTATTSARSTPSARPCPRLR